VNILSYMGLAPLMTHVMGLDNAKNRPATAQEMTEMKRLLREAMDAGACGFSAQILGKTSAQRDYDGTPMVTDTMAKEDLYAFGSVLSEVGRGFIQVTGPSIKTTENLARASGRPIIYNAVTPNVDQHGQPRKNADFMRLMDWIQEANQEKGLRIFGQGITTMALDAAFRFQMHNWNLFDVSAAWREVTLGDHEERLLRMKDPAKRKACIDEWDSGKTGKRLGLSLDRIIYRTAHKPEMKKYEGRTNGDIAKERGQHIAESFLDISMEDDLQGVWETAPKPTNVEALKMVANHPYVVPGVSDGGAHTKFITAGDFSTEFLANFCRDNDAMSLEDAHWRLAKYPATAAGMLDRGQIAVGMPADVLVYDYKNLKVCDQEISYDFPGGEWRRIKRAEGYDFTIVNGEITFEGNRCTGATPGRLLRHGHA
jgi:N-acyl-D-amino-acid deacylase